MSSNELKELWGIFVCSGIIKRLHDVHGESSILELVSAAA